MPTWRLLFGYCVRCCGMLSGRQTLTKMDGTFSRTEKRSFLSTVCKRSVGSLHLETISNKPYFNNFFYSDLNLIWYQNILLTWGKPSVLHMWLDFPQTWCSFEVTHAIYLEHHSEELVLEEIRVAVIVLYSIRRTWEHVNDASQCEGLFWNPALFQFQMVACLL